MILHPTNRVFPDGSFIPSVEDSYAAGFKRGLEWPDEWDHHPAPGGPWVYSGNHVALRNASRAANAAWVKGWREGHAKKLSKSA